MISAMLTAKSLALQHPLYVLLGGLAIAALVAWLCLRLRDYFSAENRKIRKLTGPGVVFRFLRLEFLAGLVSAGAAITYQFFAFRPHGHYVLRTIQDGVWIQGRGFVPATFRVWSGPPRHFLRFVRWDTERRLPRLAAWLRSQGERIPPGLLTEHAWERAADGMVAVDVLGVLIIAAVAFFVWEILDRRLARNAPQAAEHPPEVMIGDVPYPSKFWTSHLLISATTRWGKSTVLANMIDTFTRRQIPGLILDNAGNFLSKFFNPKADMILSLGDARAVPYSFFSELARPEDIRRLFFNLIPDGVSEAGKYFNGQARKLLIAICEALWVGGSLTNGEFCAAFRDQDRLAELLAGTEWPDLIRDAKSWGDIRATAGLYLDVFSQLPPSAGLKKIALSPSGEKWEIERTGARISRAVERMAVGHPGRIFVPYKDADAAQIGPWLSMVTAVFCDAVMGLGEDLNRRIVAVIDEGGAGSEIAKLRDILSRGGKYGLSAVFCVQSTAQADDLYGPVGAKILLANFNSVLIGRLPDTESSAWAADLIGRRYKMVSSSGETHGENHSTSESRREELRHKVLPGEIQHLPDLEGILIYSAIGLQKRVQIPRQNFPEIHSRHVDLPASAWRPAGMKPAQKPEAPAAPAATLDASKILGSLPQEFPGEAAAKAEAPEVEKSKHV